MRGRQIIDETAVKWEFINRTLKARLSVGTRANLVSTTVELTPALKLSCRQHPPQIYMEPQ